VRADLLARRDLHYAGATLDAAAEHARGLAASLGLAFLEDGASDAQLAGTGTIAQELQEAGSDVVIVPLACGALAGGMARVLKKSARPPWIAGVQSAAFPRFGALWHGEPDPGVSTDASYAGGLADSRIVEPAFGACQAFLDDVMAVDDDALRVATRTLHEHTDIVVEGAGAAPLAALQAQPERIPAGRTVLVLSGGNLDPEVAAEVLGR